MYLFEIDYEINIIEYLNLAKSTPFYAWELLIK